MSALQKFKKLANEAEEKLAEKDKQIEDLKIALEAARQESNAFFLLETCKPEEHAEFLSRFKKLFPYLWNMAQNCRTTGYRDGLMFSFEQLEKVCAPVGVNESETERRRNARLSSG